MRRVLQEAIKKDLKKKIILLSGPRQAGKTTLAKSLTTPCEYLNFDSLSDRKRILRQDWDHSASNLLILDELHKMRHWKRWLKGLYDSGIKNIFVIGSARLDIHKKVGDSMAGRFFQFHLLPLDPKELASSEPDGDPDEQLDRLLRLSGFPEPYLSDSETFYKRWRSTHLDIIIKQDLIESESIKRIADLGTLVELMRERVASGFSYSSLREDLQTDDKTIKRWMLILENAYLFFRISPYAKKLKSVIQKTPKYYFFDVPRVIDAGARFENLVALSLYKEVLYRNDVFGDAYSLHYLKDKLAHEVDFLICKDNVPQVMIEAKLSDASPSPNFSTFERHLKKMNPALRKIQLVKDLPRRFETKDGLVVEKASQWLRKLDF